MIFTPFVKRMLVLAFVANTINSVQAQSLEFGLQGGLSSAWFLNANLLKAGSEQSYGFALSHDFGVHSAINITHNVGIELEIVAATLNEGFSGRFKTEGEFPGNGVNYYAGQTYSANTEMSVIQIPVLFRYEHDLTGKYFEAGLGYEIISSAEYTATYSNPSFTMTNNITNQFPNSDFLAIVGMGWNKRFTHDSKFYFNIDFRLTYGIFDLGGVDGHGQNITGPKSVILYELPNPYYAAYHPTHAIDAIVNIGFFYRFYPHAMVHKRKIDF
ncbi:MAG TPA: outer membrane beta-barrel protein [Bacteroidia bacterium]|nr:outer membrane beta-barrel protein [Bacteroidia bacterium]